MPNDNQNTTERRIALLRESALFLRGCPSDSNREGVIDDFPDLPRELARSRH